MADFLNIQGPGSDPNIWQECFANFYAVHYSSRNMYAGNSTDDHAGREPSGQAAGRDDAAPNEIRQIIGRAIDRKLEEVKSKLKESGKCKCSCGTTGRKCEDTNCILREIHFECVSTCGKGCCNNRIRKNLLPECLHQGSRFGYEHPILYTSADINASALIVEFTGEIKRGKPIREQRHCYVLGKYSGGHRLYVDASEIGNEAKWIAHSESPNAVINEWVVDHEVRCMVTALDDIPAGSVITVNFVHCSNAKKMVYHRLTLEERQAGIKLLWVPPTGDKVEGEYRRMIEPQKKSRGKRRRH